MKRLNCLCFLMLMALINKAQTIYTFAGIGDIGYTGDGIPAVNAEVYGPSGVATDASGNVYIADANNNRVRKVNTSGIISTVAGNGTAGFSGDGGAATNAQLNTPFSVAVDAAGNIYIADANNNRIRKVNTSGIISTIAGTGTGGFSGDGGPASAAKLFSPMGVAVSAGNIFIADNINQRIRKINTSGIISTIAGNGVPGFSGDGAAATTAQLHYPNGVAVDASNNIYISDQYNLRIRKINNSGIISTFAGIGTAGYSGDGGTAAAAEISYPNGVSTDAAGNVYIADGNSVIRKINTSGIISTIAGNGLYGYSGDGGPATAATLGNARGVAFDGSGNFYIADGANNRIRKVNTSGIISTFAGNGLYSFSGDGGPSVSAQLYSPMGIAFDGTGNTYIVDSGNSRIRKVNASGVISTFAGNGQVFGSIGDGGPADSAKFFNPAGITVDKKGNVFVADASNARIRKINTSDTITTVAGTVTPGYNGDGIAATTAELNWPNDVAADTSGNIYIADRENHRIRKVDKFGIISTIAGTGTPGFSGNGGPAASAQLNKPCGVAVDRAGNIFIADLLNCRIQKINTSGIISTVAGGLGGGYSGDGGPATSAQLNNPVALDVDSAGNIYIADLINKRIRMVNTSGIISTIAGTGVSGYSGDGGPAVNAQISGVYDIAVNRAGEIFIADMGNNRIRVICSASCLAGVKELGVGSSELVVYPNPNNGEFNVRIDNEIENGKIILFNSSGQTVHEQKIIQGENNIVTNGLAKGFYFYTLTQNKNQTKTGKVIIE